MKKLSLCRILLIGTVYSLPISITNAEDHGYNGRIAVQRYMNQHELLQQKIRASQAEKDYQNQQAAQRARNSSQQSQAVRAPTQKQLNDLVNAITSDEARDAMSYLDNLKPDPYVPDNKDPVNRDGFETILTPQKSDFKYSFER